MPARPNSKVLQEIGAERARQINAEGFSHEHDDEHDRGELALAACCYAAPVPLFQMAELAKGHQFLDPWPWSAEWDRRPVEGNTILQPALYEPALRRDLLIKAGALIVAEIERLDRAAVPA